MRRPNSRAIPGDFAHLLRPRVMARSVPLQKSTQTYWYRSNARRILSAGPATVGAPIAANDEPPAGRPGALQETGLDR
jgi:hypothetical protein